MDDDRVWKFEERLWRASEERYHERVDPECVMALSHAPHLFAGQAAVDAVSGTPEWDEVAFDDKTISRPEEGMIVVGYNVTASKGDTQFKAAGHCPPRCDQRSRPPAPRFIAGAGTRTGPWCSTRR